MSWRPATAFSSASTCAHREVLDVDVVAHRGAVRRSGSRCRRSPTLSRLPAAACSTSGIRCVSGWWSSPSGPLAPATLKYRSETAASPCARASSVSIRSIASFVFPYVLTGTFGVVLGDQVDVGLAVGRRRRGEHDPLDVRRAHRVEQVQRAERRSRASSAPGAPGTRPRATAPRSAARRRTRARPPRSSASASSRSTWTKSAPSGTAARWPL